MNGLTGGFIAGGILIFSSYFGNILADYLYSIFFQSRFDGVTRISIFAALDLIPIFLFHNISISTLAICKAVLMCIGSFVIYLFKREKKLKLLLFQNAHIMVFVLAAGYVAQAFSNLFFPASMDEYIKKQLMFAFIQLLSGGYCIAWYMVQFRILQFDFKGMNLKTILYALPATVMPLVLLVLLFLVTHGIIKTGLGFSIMMIPIGALLLISLSFHFKFFIDVCKVKQNVDEFELDRQKAEAELKKINAEKIHKENVKTIALGMERDLMQIIEYARNRDSVGIERIVKGAGNVINAERPGLAKTGNNIIDSILYSKAEKCRKGEIEFKLNVGPVRDKIETISDIELCSVIANGMDNAIEASMRLHNPSNRSLSCTIVERPDGAGGSLMIVLANNYDGIKHQSAFFSISSKRESGPGFGMRNIKRCVEDANGTMSLREDGLQVVLAISIPLT